MASMKRGVGYCENTDCEDYAKGVFLLNHGDTFYCPRCRQLGKVEKERGFYTGNTDIFKEVRVEYNFDPINTVYREIAIVSATRASGVATTCIHCNLRSSRPRSAR
jgi:ribosomal protein S27AE